MKDFYSELAKLIRESVRVRLAERFELVTPQHHTGVVIHTRGYKLAIEKYLAKNDPLQGLLHTSTEFWLQDITAIIEATRTGTGLNDGAILFELLAPLETTPDIVGTWEAEQCYTEATKRLEKKRVLVTRLRFICQPFGSEWLGKHQAGLSATEDELKNPENWKNERAGAV